MPEFIKHNWEKQRLYPNMLDTKPDVISNPEIIYEDGEIGRMWDIFLWNILNRIAPSFPLIESLDEWMMHTVNIYNHTQPETVDPEIIYDAFERAMVLKNKPTTKEQVHFWNWVGISKYSSKHKDLISISRYTKYLEIEDPFIYKQDRNNDDVHKFCNWFIHTLGNIKILFSVGYGWNTLKEYKLKKLKFLEWVQDGRIKPEYNDGTPMPMDVVRDRVHDDENSWAKY